MITKKILIRMNYKTYRELRHYFPAKRGESAADYFDRLINDILIEPLDLDLEAIAERKNGMRFRK